MALSLLVFLTVSFHSSPYYTGADIVFVFAWTPLLLAGAGPLLSADAAIAANPRARQGSRRVNAEGASRREVVLKSTVTAMAAVGGLVLGGVAAGLGRLAGDAKNNSNSGTALSPPPSSAAASQVGPTASGSGGGHPAGSAIGAAKDVPVGAVEMGPATSGLTPITIAEGGNGQLYAV